MGGTERQTIRPHAGEGAEHLEKQRALIARLTKDGSPFHDTETLLLAREDIQRQREAPLTQTNP